MPFELKFENASEVLAKFADLQTRIDALTQGGELAKTFLDWQREDLNSRYPQYDGGFRSVSRVLYPRSRLQRTGRKKTNRKSVRRRSLVTARRRGSHRPILRPELFDKLRQRMVAMLEAALKWQ